jgi:hypothetical protein
MALLIADKGWQKIDGAAKPVLMTDTKITDRRFYKAEQEADFAEQQLSTPQTRSKSYRLAFQDAEFLLREDLRPVRFQLELLKHQQTMTGLVLHKVSQTLSDTLQAAMKPLNKVNFENRAHQEVLKGVLYFVGTREITGQEPDMGLWASVEQGIAALKGAIGSAASY